MPRTDEVLNLGEIIAKLNKFPENALVRFDFGMAVPTGIDSWRGIYSELAIGYRESFDAPTRKEVVEMLEKAIGKTYHGYKGGDYTMSTSTKVYCDNWGEWTSRHIFDVQQYPDEIVYLKTSQH